MAVNGWSRAVSSGILCGALAFSSCVGCKKKPEPASSNDESVAAADEIKNEDAPLPDKPLTAGDEVFDFQALAHTGQRIVLSEFLTKPSLFYFCPQDDTPQCTQLALTIRDRWLELNANLDMVFAVTPAPTVVHREFASEHELPHLLLADTDTKVHQIFGLKPGMLVAYLVGADREVLRVFPITDAATLVSNAEAALQELQLLGKPYPL